MNMNRVDGKSFTTLCHRHRRQRSAYACGDEAGRRAAAAADADVCEAKHQFGGNVRWSDVTQRSSNKKLLL